jgi:ribosome recycling factor
VVDDAEHTESGLPASRDLSEIINACKIVEAEHGYQAYRLRELVQPRTEDERAYHAKMAQEYEAARKQTRRLRGYHEKRLKRQEETGSTTQTSLDSSRAIDAAGRATAYIDDSEAPV